MIDSIYNIVTRFTSPQTWFQIISIIQESKGIIKFESEFLRKNGKKWIGELNLRIVRDEKGVPISIEGFVQDITSRKQTEQALQESEAKYRTIFENTGAATLLIEEDTTYVSG